MWDNGLLVIKKSSTEFYHHKNFLSSNTSFLFSLTPPQIFYTKIVKKYCNVRKVVFLFLIEHASFRCGSRHAVLSGRGCTLSFFAA